MRVFLDTNVIVSAVATRGLCADVLREVLVRHQLVISETLLVEVKRVLRDKICVPAAIIKDLVAFLRKDSLMAKALSSAGPPGPNSVDKELISAAVSAQADLFVTGDRKLLDRTPGGSLEIVSPRMFWERLKRKR